MKKIKATLNPDGTMKLEVLGAAGTDCLEFTRELERRLGVVLHRELKPECDAEELVIEHVVEGEKAT